MKNEIGNTYNRLTVIKRGPNDKQGNAQWYCKCSCGNPELILARGYALRNGSKKSCGCLHIETARAQGNANRKTNKYDLTGSYGIGYTLKGEKFYFDLEDYDLIKDYCWHITAQGYLACKRKENILMHRLIMNAPSTMEVDHINHNTVDNRKQNLRICATYQNAMNKGASNISTSGVRGVYWYSQQQKWSAEIIVQHKKYFLGLFDNIEDAIKIRKQAEEKMYKEFQYKEGSDVAYDKES